MLLRSLVFAVGVGAVLVGIVFIYWPAALVVGGVSAGIGALLVDDGKPSA